MTLFILAYAAGLFTIASPCIVPILPFVLARSGVPFTRGGLPLLVGLALTFAVVATLASVAGGWAIDLNRNGRVVALAVMALFGLTLLWPALAERVMAPLVALGTRLSDWAAQRGTNGDGRPADASRPVTAGASLLLGVATGLLWAPCAGPVMGLILTGAALRGPSLQTSLLLLAYGLGAATSLALGLAFGRRLLAHLPWSPQASGGVRRVLGAAVVAGAVVIALGADTGLLTRLSSVNTARLEQNLIDALRMAPTPAMAEPGQVAAAAALPAFLRPLFDGRSWVGAPLRPEDLRGKVVLVNFWTYSCINCLRTLPYVRAWADKYRDQGLVVIGAHTPEFAFEKDVGNVRKAAASLGVRYPVVIDNDFAIWRAFGNQAWPALYFIGVDGRVRHHTLGEGDYETSELLIQKLLAEARDRSETRQDISDVSGEGAQAPADAGNLQSGETYLGYNQATGFASPGGIRPGVASRYRAASSLPLNRWSLDGAWTIGGEFATLNDKGGSILHRFHARDLHLVLGPSARGQPVRFRVTIDGKPPGADHGTDIDADGFGSVKEERLYQLVRQAGQVTDRTFQIEFLDAGVHAYAFTFG
ncbi:cytochrome c biogenesis protein DipZ [Bradyrhizobium prioriisuperbiae]|uniref:cytochrome c biogenesis protein DipZ n=1 Tax=Bradyrhizobium prioriisuperbiae TaxID=2854389 RepID=UPI0028ECC094|nr:cytochrome c biogenesis protein DipZ [Bradyrhizobium prioritasuperba]